MQRLGLLGGFTLKHPQHPLEQFHREIGFSSGRNPTFFVRYTLPGFKPSAKVVIYARGRRVHDLPKNFMASIPSQQVTEIFD